MDDVEKKKGAQSVEAALKHDMVWVGMVVVAPGDALGADWNSMTSCSSIF